MAEQHEFQCDECEKSYKTEKGLEKHKAEKHPLQEEVLPLEDTPEDLEEGFTGTDDEESVSTTESQNEARKPLLDEYDRRIEKLKSTIDSCYDAETKHRLEKELKDLKKQKAELEAK